MYVESWLLLNQPCSSHSSVNKAWSWALWKLMWIGTFGGKLSRMMLSASYFVILDGGSTQRSMTRTYKQHRDAKVARCREMPSPWGFLTRLDLAAGGTGCVACPWGAGSVGRLGRSPAASPWDRLPTYRQLGRSREQGAAVTPRQGRGRTEACVNVTTKLCNGKRGSLHM